MALAQARPQHLLAGMPLRCVDTSHLAATQAGWLTMELPASWPMAAGEKMDHPRLAQASRNLAPHFFSGPLMGSHARSFISAAGRLVQPV